MFRQALLRPAAALRAPLRPAAVARRWQSSTSVNVPNTGSVPPPAEVSHAYAPGEEIDPQRESFSTCPPGEGLSVNAALTHRYSQWLSSIT